MTQSPPPVSADEEPQPASQDRDTSSLIIYLKGVAMGGADAVPGVSGGTIALMVGIYDRLIAAISSLDGALLRAVLRARHPEQRQALVRRLGESDLRFLLTLGLGIGSALIGLAEIITVALADFPALTFAFFFGLIGASAITLGAELSVQGRWQLPSALAGFGLAFLLADGGGASLPNSLPIVFVSGTIAISAMVLPGISGSFLLLLLDQYEFIFGTVSAFVDAVLTADPGGVIEHGIVVATFGTGALLGVLTTARVVKLALERARMTTLTFLISLMVGALRLPYARVLAETPEFTLTSVIPLVTAGLIGVLAVVLLDRQSAGLG
jgi:putative membrane protein